MLERHAAEKICDTVGRSSRWGSPRSRRRLRECERFLREKVELGSMQQYCKGPKRVYRAGLTRSAVVRNARLVPAVDAMTRAAQLVPRLVHNTAN
jgi:hypothetical protein